MSRDELDIQLLAFLRDQKAREEREDRGIHKALGDLTNQVNLLGQKLDANHTIIGERIAGLSARIDKLEDDVEDTGVHNLKKLESELEAQRAKEAKLAELAKSHETKRGDVAIGFAVKVGAGLLLLLIGALVQHLAFK